MITELYLVTALLCDRHRCWQQTMWTGTDRNQCMVQAVQARVNPPPYVKETKMSACLVERAKPGYEWTEQGYWRKIRD